MRLIAGSKPQILKIIKYQRVPFLDVKIDTDRRVCILLICNIYKEYYIWLVEQLKFLIGNQLVDLNALMTDLWLYYF
jgi:hypothetical protein